MTRQKMVYGPLSLIGGSNETIVTATLLGAIMTTSELAQAEPSF